jgi:predicted RNA-binding protein YlxR (DUF448 family)
MLARLHDSKLDRGAARVAPGMERHCALSHMLKPVDEMIRFVVGPDGDAVPDVKRKLPGRGIWITATRAALAAAIKRNVFARGFKRDVRVAAIWRQSRKAFWSAVHLMRSRSPVRPARWFAASPRLKRRLAATMSWL